MFGAPVRVHDLTGDDLGVAHVPVPVQVGDLIALEHSEHRVVDVIDTGQTYPIAALVRVQPVSLRPLVSS